MKKTVSYSNSVVKLKKLNFKKIKHCNINEPLAETKNSRIILIMEK